jgi:hypothetical protein
MRILFVAFALIASIALPRSSSAEDRVSARPAQNVVEASLANQLPRLVHALAADLIPSARAAECTSEGETRTSNEQCCPGLECSGGPPATCVEED